jgi:hypothetical protein
MHSAITPRHSPFSMIRSMAKYSMKKSASYFRRLLIERVQHGVAGAVGRGAGALHRRAFAHVLHVAAERTLVDRAILGCG